MSNNILVKVYMASSSEPVFTRSIYLNKDLYFPYEVVTAALRALYSSNCTIVFENSIVE